MSDYLKFVLVLTGAFLLFVAGAVGYAIGHGDALELERENKVLDARYRSRIDTIQRLTALLKDREKLPNVNMREFNATQTVTFTIDGRELRCLALLNRLGDATTLSCDWEAWRHP